jgi:hypothetical protein
MDSWLAEVAGLWAFGFDLLVQHHHAVPPELGIAFRRVLRPMNVHAELVPFLPRLPVPYLTSVPAPSFFGSTHQVITLL